jgi:hypothetical protein
MLRRSLALAVLCGAMALVGTGAAHAAPARIAVVSTQATPASLAPGSTLSASGKVINRGAAKKVTVRLAVRRGATTVNLASTKITARPHAKTAYTIKAALPEDVTPGRYSVLACAGGACRAAGPILTVAGPQPTSSASESPAPEPAAPVAAAEPEPAPAAAAPVAPTVYSSGARTGGDSLFPFIGNGGYDVQHYALDLSYTITSKVLTGTATMTATATQNLSDFSLDLQYLDVESVTVDGVPAKFERDSGTKLIITPAHGIDAGSDFTVATKYGGVEQAVIDPDGSSEGFVPSTTYGAIVVSEPIGAQGWFPNNNVPYDKASFEVKMTVPDGWTVVGSGNLLSQDSTAGFTTFHWSETHPIPTYLASVAIGKYDLSYSALDGPRPQYIAMDSSFTTGKATMGATRQRTAAIDDWYSAFYGVDYPWSTTGGIVPRQSVSYSLETVSKPIYATSTSATTTGPSLGTISHENGHMWFGDFVTLRQWKDIWLNEGMTEFSSWLWQERVNGSTPTATRFTTQYASTSSTFWNIAPAAPPTAADIFDSNAMYTRGAMVMEAIREIVGEPAWVAIQKAWLTGHAYGNATTEEYIALVKSMTDKDPARWTEFFKQWLYTPYTGSPAAGNKPQMTPSNFDTYVLPA